MKTTLQKAIEALRELENDKTIIGIYLARPFISDMLVDLDQANDIINNENLKP
jgi:N-acetylglucosamine-6-phosphate deacetylase